MMCDHDVSNAGKHRIWHFGRNRTLHGMEYGMEYGVERLHGSLFVCNCESSSIGEFLLALEPGGELDVIQRNTASL
jgi:hypothetical protein